MTIKLYVNESDNNVINKSLTTLTTLTGNLVNETEFINPVLRIKTTESNAVQCNYIYIQEFNRYYYVKSCKCISNGLFEFYLKVDVLKSWWNYFKECDCIIERQEKKFNKLLDDGTFKAYQNPYVITKKFPHGLTANELILVVSGSTQSNNE